MTLKLLLIDDSLTFISAIRHFLDHLPDVTIVGHAHDGKSALAQLREHLPDVVLLDIAMPGMNGLELARAIGASPQRPKIILLSMHDNQEYGSAAHELGASFVSKADFVNELIPALEALARSTPRRPMAPPDRDHVA